MSRTIQHWSWFVFFLCTCAVMPFFASADTDYTGLGLRNTENAVRILVTPDTPKTGDTMHLEAESALFDLTKSVLTWRIDGQVVAQGTGATKAEYAVGASATSIDVSLSVEDPLWGSASSDLTITPLELDIVFDAPTYVPPFYRGRALPSGGGSMRLQAIARFPGTRGTLADSSITYTWRRNNRILTSLSGLGKSNIVIDAPTPGDTDTISVRASANDDTLSATASVAIPSSEPAVMLYEDHPLFGVLFHSALPQEIPSRGDITVAAVPYFVTAQRLNDPVLKYSWRINEQPATASSTQKNEITLRSDSGTQSLELELLHASNFFLDVLRTWKFLFGAPQSGNGSARSSPQDIFHNTQQ